MNWIFRSLGPLLDRLGLLLLSTQRPPVVTAVGFCRGVGGGAVGDRRLKTLTHWDPRSA